MTSKNESLLKIEKFFKKPFAEIITVLHWTEKLSINRLSKQCGVSRDVFMCNAKKQGLKLMSIQQANILNKPRGADHWAWGKTKDNSDIHKKHSIRMKENNPAFNNKNLIIVAAKNAVHFRNRALIQEVKFREILIGLDVDFIFQHPVNRYVIDFFIPKLNLCIEIDSVAKWGKASRRRALKKDLFLNSVGLKVLRIDKRLVKDKLRIIQILQANNII